ncbi:MAG: CPBP family intramembrane glutamic endopeptidase [Microterricola sp.]
MSYVTFFAPLLFGVIALVLILRRRLPVLATFGLSVSRHSPLDFLAGLTMPAIAIALVFFTEKLLGAITVSPGSITWPTFLNDVLAQLFLAAVLEELLFRVLLLTGLALLLDGVPAGRWIAVLLTGALFGAAHLGNEGASWVAAVGTGLGGVIYGIAFLATRSVWLPLALHMSWNMAQGLFGFPISGNHVPGLLTSDSTGDVLWNGGAYGPEAGIPGLLARFLIIALLFLYLKRRYPSGRIATLRFAPDPVRRPRQAGRRDRDPVASQRA